MPNRHVFSKALVVFACLSPGEWTCGFVRPWHLLNWIGIREDEATRVAKALRPSGTRKDETGNVIAAKRSGKCGYDVDRGNLRMLSIACVRSNNRTRRPRQVVMHISIHTPYMVKAVRPLKLHEVKLRIAETGTLTKVQNLPWPCTVHESNSNIIQYNTGNTTD